MPGPAMVHYIGAWSHDSVDESHKICQRKERAMVRKLPWANLEDPWMPNAINWRDMGAKSCDLV